MSHSVPPLRGGHRLQLLEGSREFFPALVDAMDLARQEVRLETYIFDFTGSSVEVAYALERAARRGLAVMVVVDGLGSPALSPAWRHRFEQAGVQWQVYSPLSKLGLLWPGQWRRLHRKLCVIDGQEVFCGGINILDDFHDPNHGALAAPRFDFAVRVTGPLAVEATSTMARFWQRTMAMRRLSQARLTGVLDSLRASSAAVPQGSRHWRPPDETTPPARAALVLRDNLGNRTRIERAYRRAVGSARTEVIIANAYFVPGRKMRLALVAAAQRGVRVRLLVQGRYEYFMQYYASRPIYGALLRAGVEIHEYAPSFLHAKVAVVDGHWATVGSSNLDPLSLLLAREANVMVEDAQFASCLRKQSVDRGLKAGFGVETHVVLRRSGRCSVLGVLL